MENSDRSSAARLCLRIRRRGAYRLFHGISPRGRADGQCMAAFLAQFKQIKKLGSIEGLLKLIPGAKKMGLNNINIDPKDMARVEAIILSMTPEERRKPEIIKANRKIRIAKGSGTSVQEVNKLLTQFEQSKKMMKMFSNGSFKMPF